MNARRALAVLGLLLLAALVAWVLLGEDLGLRPRARQGTAPAAADDASDPDAAAKKRDKARHRDEKPAARVDPTLTAFLRRFEEIGQDKEQDPALGAITGRVYASPGESAGECVVEALVRGAPVARGRVRAGPAFRLKNVPPSAGIALSVISEVYAPGGMDKLVVHGGATLDIGTVYLGLPFDPTADNRIEVVVRAAGAEPKPLPGALVTATTASFRTLITMGNLEKTPGGTMFRGIADGEGRVLFEHLPPARYDFFAEAEGFTFDVDEQRIVQHGTKAKIELDLEPGLTIEGVVHTDDGKPVAGARIVTVRWGGAFEPMPTVVSDAEGRFTVKGCTAARYIVVAAKEELGAKEMQQVAGGTKDLDIVIPPGGDLWLKVTDASSGEPVKEFGVRPYRKMPFAYIFSPLFEAKTQDGIYKEKLLPAQDYGVEVTAPGYAMLNVSSVPIPAAAPLEVKLEPAGVVRGRVVGKTSAKPISGANVFVKRGGIPPSKVKDQQTVTNADGLFTLSNLARKPVTLTIAHVDHDEAAFADVVPSAIAAGGTPDVRTFELGDGGRVVGHVMGPAGQPVSGQRLSLMKGFDWTTARSAQTDATGAYAFDNVPPAPKYTLSLGDSGPGRPGRSRNDVAVREGETTTIDFGTDQGGLRVAGKVMLGEKGAGGRTVRIAPTDGGAFQGEEKSADDGTFAFEHVPAGRFIVRAEQVTVDVNVPAEGTVPEVMLTLAAGSISGKVVDKTTRQPIAAVWIDCSLVGEGGAGGYADLLRNNRGTRTTMADGLFTFQGLAEGTYLLRAYRESFGTELTEVRVVGAASVDGVEVTMAPAGTVSGVVRDSAGNAIEGVAITFRDLTGRRVFGISFATSEGDGHFTQGALRPDTYDLTADKDGFAPSTQRVQVAVGTPAATEFTLYKGGSLEVLVKNADGAAIADAAVALLDASGQVVTRGVTLLNMTDSAIVKSNALGVATLTGLLPATYRVRVTPRGAAASIEQAGVVVMDGTTVRAEVVIP